MARGRSARRGRGAPHGAGYDEGMTSDSDSDSSSSAVSLDSFSDVDLCTIPESATRQFQVSGKLPEGNHDTYYQGNGVVEQSPSACESFGNASFYCNSRNKEGASKKKKERTQLPRVPTVNRASQLTCAASKTDNNIVNNKEHLLRILFPRRKDRTLRILATQMLEQESPFLFYAYLLEIVTHVNETAVDNTRAWQKQIKIILDMMSNTLMSKSFETTLKFLHKRLQPKGESNKENEDANVPAAASSAMKGRFDGRKVRTLLALEALSHNCNEHFASILLGHIGIHNCLEAIVAHDLHSENEVFHQSAVIAKRLLDWSEYSKTSSGTLVRKWCSRMIDSLYSDMFQGWYTSKGKDAALLCHMSKWEWLADLEEAVVRIQACFRGFHVRDQMKKRAHYGYVGPYTSRIFPFYRANAPETKETKETREETTRVSASPKLWGPTEQDLLRRYNKDVKMTRYCASYNIGSGTTTTTNPSSTNSRVVSRHHSGASSISSVGESLMALLPLENVSLKKVSPTKPEPQPSPQQHWHESQQEPFTDRAKVRPHATDSDYDSGTEYAASNRMVTSRAKSTIPLDAAPGGLSANVERARRRGRLKDRLDPGTFH
eukprot:CAMPEP_0198237214 /NCGR_PEP_ID=MMETSP1446-20131203/3056_1 /TAXON_ID=1461542 ORGANISM="Unidentified sp, Strain CCMP2111" /NCGR_SAMPLE_ID=MMETSP1446 /ASSEMBLY_ACC=CAM_ASM_001112 /LENGTH=603 /DNA_ID=CAMNT_0043919281 /DNA_START=171 /DNA_END=1983 /DNA_ORIENTATION=+